MKLLTQIFLTIAICLPQILKADGEVEIETTDYAEVSFGAGYKATLKLDPDHATVGKLTKVIGTVTRYGQPVKNALMTLTFHHIEDDADNYKTTLLAPDGTFTVNHQFFDGAAHQIVLDVAPPQEGNWPAAQVSMNIDVEGIQPPKSVILKTLLLLLGVTAIGMVIGFKLGNRA